jgi:lysophospholipase L1-like esterase
MGWDGCYEMVGLRVRCMIWFPDNMTNVFPPIRLIAALGSSFAAGPGIDPIVDIGAMRSGANYPHLLAKALRADLVDLTVSGATTANILDEPQLTAAGMNYPPQVSGLPPEADLVTITAGGNDLQFIGSMLFAAWSKAEPDGLITQMLAETFGGGIREATESDVSALAEGFLRIVSAVHSRAGQARIVLVDYLTVVTERTPTGDGEPFTAAELSALLRIQCAIAEAYRIAAARSEAELLTVSAISGDHGIESIRPWVFGFRAKPEETMASFHPNRDGMTAVTDELLRLLTTPRH